MVKQGRWSLVLSFIALLGLVGFFDGFTPQAMAKRAAPQATGQAAHRTAAQHKHKAKHARKHSAKRKHTKKHSAKAKHAKKHAGHSKKARHASQKRSARHAAPARAKAPAPAQVDAGGY
jgi:hypothetical protein